MNEEQGLDDKTVEAVRAFLAGALERMGYEVALEVRREGPEALVEVTGADAAQVIGKKGATLDALQVLANRVARKHSAGERGYVLLDADGYRERREKSLETMAVRLGEQALREKRTITLEPMTPRDRRVVHMALARFPGVSTRSQGEGLERRLQIIPMPKR